VSASYALVYFARGGPTHEQFVWISSFQPILVIALLAPITARISIKNVGGGPWRGTALLPLAVPLLCLVVALANGRTLTRAFAETPDATAAVATANPERPRFGTRWVDQSLGALGGATALESVDAVDIGLATSWETMWAAAQLDGRTLHLISSSDLPATGAHTGTRLIDTGLGDSVLAIPLTNVVGRFSLACTGRIATGIDLPSSCLCAWSRTTDLEISSFLLTLPALRWQGYAPLWVRGPSKEADILGISWDGAYVELLHDHWGTAPQVSGPRFLTPDVSHRFDVVIDDGRLAVFVDGGLLLSSSVPTYPEGEVSLGRNDIGASTVFGVLEAPIGFVLEDSLTCADS
jgi:hypothetical protein